MVSLPALPPQHVPRARLVDALAPCRVGIVEAGGGYGKSVLATELRRELRTASAEAELDRDTAQAQELIGALRRGMRRAGLSDVATALAGSTPAEIVRALDRSAEPVLLVVEEVQHASGEAAAALADLARELGDRHRLLLVGRRLDPRIARLERAIDAVHLGAEALAFDDDELSALLANALEREATEDEQREVRRITAGWPAAAALAASRLARGAIAPASELRAGARPLGGLLDEMLAGLGDEERRRIAHLAHLPLLSEPVAAACAGPGALDLLLDAGLPLRAGRPGWAELPDPIGDELAARDALPREAARAAAAAYADQRELPTAIALLARTGDHDEIAALLASRRWQELAVLDLAELRAIISTLPSEAIAAHPFALVQVARLAEQEVDFELRTELLERAVALVAGERERREVEGELVATRAIDEPGEEVEAAATALLAAADGSEAKARSRALTALARVEAWRGDHASMLLAERHLGEAGPLCRLAGEVEWEAWTLVALAYVGRVDEAEAALGEAAAIGRKLGDHRVQAYCAWTGATIASLQGDAAAAIQRLHTAERHPGDWFEHPTGIEFLADGSLALARGRRSRARGGVRGTCSRASRLRRLPGDRLNRHRRGRGPLG